MIALPSRLRGRLLLSHFIVAAATLGTILVGISLVGPGYFAEAMGHPADDPHAPLMDVLTLAAFDDAMRKALLAAAVTALIAAVIVSLAISGRIAGPVSRLAATAHRVAAGYYAERVTDDGRRRGRRAGRGVQCHERVIGRGRAPPPPAGPGRRARAANAAHHARRLSRGA